MKGSVRGAKRVPLRVHSECLLGDALGSLRCQCGAQLRSFIEEVLGNGEPNGVLLYLQGHEGKGIGLTEKLRAYALRDEDESLTEAQANRLLGYAPDLRRYGAAKTALEWLGIESAVLYSGAWAVHLVQIGSRRVR